jgi:hypothetical protein
MIYQGNVFIPHNTLVRGNLDRYGMRFQQPVPAVASIHASSLAPQGMHPRAFQGLLASIENTPFDRSKLQIAQAALQNNYVTTQQVALIMRQFTFDKYRLDIAKYAYASSVDPQFYYLLAQEFTFDSNARALMRYTH